MHMAIRKKKFNGEEFEILEHDEVPGFRTVFNITITSEVKTFLNRFVICS
jgi:hypothetical protein